MVSFVAPRLLAGEGHDVPSCPFMVPDTGEEVGSRPVAARRSAVLLDVPAKDAAEDGPQHGGRHKGGGMHAAVRHHADRQAS